MKTRMVRVRRVEPVRRAAALFLLALGAFVWLTARRGDPVAAILSARDAERTAAQVVFDPLALHAVRTAVCDSEAAARVEAARYASRGAAGFILRREVWHVLAAGYDTAEEADAVRDGLREKEGMSCDTVSLVCGPARLRVTATAEQTAALTGCEAALRDRGRAGEAALGAGGGPVAAGGRGGGGGGPPGGVAAPGAGGPGGAGAFRPDGGAGGPAGHAVFRADEGAVSLHADGGDRLPGLPGGLRVSIAKY